MTTGRERIPATMALFRFRSQIWAWVKGRIAIESNKRPKKETDQNGKIFPKFSISPPEFMRNHPFLKRLFLADEKIRVFHLKPKKTSNANPIFVHVELFQLHGWPALFPVQPSF
jgi:hypothetical protein